MKKLALVLALSILVGGLASGESPSSTSKILVPFIVSSTGHILVTVKINSIKACMLVDTAAGASVIHSRKVKELGLTERRCKSKVKSLGTSSYSMKNLIVPQMTLVDVVYYHPGFISIDLKHIEEAGGKYVLYGILGSRFLQKHEAIIDYEKYTITLNRPLIRNSKLISAKDGK